VSRLPIRWKVTLAFAGSLAVVLVAVGAFLYLRFESDLSESVDRGLRSRADDVAAAVRRSGAGLTADGARRLVEADESFAQVVSPAGAIVDATPLARRPLLTADELRRARAGAILVEHEGGGVEGETIRLLAVPVRVDGDRVVAVVGTSLDDMEESLASLLVLELIGLGAALLLASAAGYWVSGLALRPVEAMRRQADDISGEPGKRLPVSPAHDELGRLGSTLNAMLGRLDEASAAQRAALAKERRFVADASHELRTPLTVLRSEVDVAMQGDRDRDELRAALASVGEEAERLSRLAEDLLVLARTDEGELPIRTEPLSAWELMEGVARRQRVRPAAVAREIAVRASDGLTVRGDRLRLEQALSNLVDNALRHGAGRVELVAELAGDELHLGVSDEGRGFPEEFRTRAFERFARPDAGRSGRGVGLGLAIVEAIAKAHGGSAFVEADGAGTRVVIVLPAG
jgi:two-component system OmpR family sensor kinase